jgi:hypothetical protein
VLEWLRGRLAAAAQEPMPCWRMRARSTLGWWPRPSPPERPTRAETRRAASSGLSTSLRRSRPPRRSRRNPRGGSGWR